MTKLNAPLLMLIATGILMSACGQHTVSLKALPQFADETADMESNSTASSSGSTTDSSSGSTASSTSSSSSSSSSSGNAATVTFSQIESRILRGYGCTGCHSAFTSYAGVMGMGPQKMYAKMQAGTMPKVGSRVTPVDLQFFADWISEGTPNN